MLERPRKEIDLGEIKLRRALKHKVRYLPRLTNGGDQLTPISDAAMAEALKIAAKWNELVPSIVEIGHKLKGAKKKFPGEFHAMIEQVMPFGVRTAQRLMEIAEHPILSNATHVSRLPPSWGTLATLTAIPQDQLLLMLKDGTINADLQRKEAKELVERSQDGGLYFQKDLLEALTVLYVIKRAWTGEELARKFEAYGHDDGSPADFPNLQELSQWLAAWHAECQRIDAEINAESDREWGEAKPRRRRRKKQTPTRPRKQARARARLTEPTKKPSPV